MATTSLFFDIFGRDVNVKETFAGIEAAGARTGKALGGLLGPLGLGLAGLGIADAVGHMVKAAGDFEAANTRLATSAGESVSNLKMVGDGILQVAQDTGTSTDALEKGAYYIESAGFHGAEMLQVLKAAAQGAKAEGSSVETVGDAVTSALRDYHLTASDAADVTSKMITAVGDGKTTFELFAGSLHSVLPVAASAHISLDDILGDLASMTVHGMSADQATQDLNHTIMKLINPTQQQTSEFALFGTTAQEVQGKLGSSGLSGTLDFLHDKIVHAMPPGADRVILDMKTALQGMSPEVQKLGTEMISGSITMGDFVKQLKSGTPEAYTQGRALLSLLGQTHKLGTEQLTGEEVLQNYTQAWRLLTGDQTGAATAMMLTGENADYTHKAVNDVSKATKDAAGNVKGWSDIQDTFNNKLDRFKEVIATSAIKIGEKLLPALGDGVDGFINFYNQVAPLLPAIWDNDIKPMLDNIGKMFSEIFGDTGGSGSVVQNAADGFGSAMDKVGTNANGTMGTDGTIARAVADFRRSMQSVGDGIKGFTDALPQLNAATDDVTNAVNQSGIDTRNYVVSMVEGWNSGLETMFLRASVFQYQIEAAFANAQGWLENAGANIVLGLINGMVSMIPNLVGQAISLGNQAVQSVKDALGIHSPSTVFHGIGVNLGQGLINGLDSMHGPTRDAMGRLGSVAVGGFDMTAGMSARGGAALAAGGGFPTSVRLVVDGHEFNAYVDARAGSAIDAADNYATRRQSR